MANKKVNEDSLCRKYPFLLNGHERIFNDFIKEMEHIPEEDFLKILLEIYIMGNVEIDFFAVLLKLSVNLETPEDKGIRIERNRDALKQYLDEEQNLLAYRGCGNGDAGDAAISYTVSRDIAEWFANRKKHFGSKKVWVSEKKISIDDVILYTNDREEEEVIVIKK
jgi:hypothetical protein